MNKARNYVSDQISRQTLTEFARHQPLKTERQVLVQRYLAPVRKFDRWSILENPQ